MICPYITLPDSSSPEEWQALLRTAPRLVMGQSWRSEPEPGFSPSFVQLAWDGECILVLAELQDEEIVTRENLFNEPFFLNGDAFEIFLKPEPSKVYYEFHIGPEGQMMQLRMPSEAEFRATRETGKICQDYFVSEPRIARQVWIPPEENRWVVTARIPLQALSEKEEVKSGDRWQVSLCRYDHFHDGREPVTSSTSPFTQHDFHRTGEWRSFRLAEKKPL